MISRFIQFGLQLIPTIDIEGIRFPSLGSQMFLPETQYQYRAKKLITTFICLH